MSNFDIMDIAIGKAIKHYRKQKNVTQQEINDVVKRGRSWCSDVERGKQTVYFKDVIAICKHLDVSIDEMTEYVDK